MYLPQFTRYHYKSCNTRVTRVIGRGISSTRTFYRLAPNVITITVDLRAVHVLRPTLVSEIIFDERARIHRVIIGSDRTPYFDRRKTECKTLRQLISIFLHAIAGFVFFSIYETHINIVTAEREKTSRRGDSLEIRTRWCTVETRILYIETYTRFFFL